MPAGYSRRPLASKLGIRAGQRVKVRNAPRAYEELAGPLPEGVRLTPAARKDVDLWHLFTVKRRELEAALRSARGQIAQDGMIWVSWPKKSSGVPSEVSEDTVREVALPLGLVDVKVCAVDEVWSGLKLVIRKELRG